MFLAFLFSAFPCRGSWSFFPTLADGVFRCLDSFSSLNLVAQHCSHCDGIITRSLLWLKQKLSLLLSSELRSQSSLLPRQFARCSRSRRASDSRARLHLTTRSHHGCRAVFTPPNVTEDAFQVFLQSSASDTIHLPESAPLLMSARCRSFSSSPAVFFIRCHLAASASSTAFYVVEPHNPTIRSYVNCVREPASNEARWKILGAGSAPTSSRWLNLRASFNYIRIDASLKMQLMQSCVSVIFRVRPPHQTLVAGNTVFSQPAHKMLSRADVRLPLSRFIFCRVRILRWPTSREQRCSNDSFCAVQQILQNVPPIVSFPQPLHTPASVFTFSVVYHAFSFLSKSVEKSTFFPLFLPHTRDYTGKSLFSY